MRFPNSRARKRLFSGERKARGMGSEQTRGRAVQCREHGEPLRTCGSTKQKRRGRDPRGSRPLRWKRTGRERGFLLEETLRLVQERLRSRAVRRGRRRGRG